MWSRSCEDYIAEKWEVYDENEAGKKSKGPTKHSFESFTAIVIQMHSMAVLV